MSEHAALAPPAVVVLAAGRGSRFSGPGHKLAQPFGHDGRTLLDHSVANAVATGLPVVLVVTERFALEPAACRADVLVCLPDDDQSGIGRSIAAGVSAVPGAGGWLVLPADMPLILPQSISRVAQALGRANIVRASCQGKGGHPVGFGSRYYAQLADLRGDIGARILFSRCAPSLIETGDVGVTRDIDTVEDLAMASAAATTLCARACSQPIPDSLNRHLCER